MNLITLTFKCHVGNRLSQEVKDRETRKAETAKPDQKKGQKIIKVRLV